MRHSVDSSDIALFGQLDMVYNHLRYVESEQNKGKFACKGSGQCCKIGLRLHMFECASIAYHIRQQYYLTMEDNGKDAADEFMSSTVNRLIDAMFDKDWADDGKTTRFCAFYDNGCTIYGYRPMVCRSYGTITHVDDGCPRERNEYGHIDYYSGTPIEEAVKAFQDLMIKYADGKQDGGNYDMVLYMPLGVLSFLLPDEQLGELYQKTDPKFWMSAEGWFNYRTHFTKLYGYDNDVLTKAANDAGCDIILDDVVDETLVEIER
jgi:Fe-S-cluster containining protein